MSIILDTDPPAEDREVIDQGLRAYNAVASGRGRQNPDFVDLVLRDSDTGEALGGLTAVCYGDWMFVENLFVPENMRGYGWGARLMAEAEIWAREKKLVGIWLDTFEFQAPEFYKKCGFEVFGELPEFPRGSKRIFLRKLLQS